MEFLMQPIRGSSFLEEVGESLLPPPSTSPSAVPAAGAVVAVPADQVLPEDGAAWQERATSSAEAQILSVRQVPADRRDNSPPTSDLSTGKMNPRAPGWNKRLRIGAAAPSRPPCTNRVSAFEKAVRSYAENPSDNVVTPVIGMTFDSVGEAYDFYNMYSWEKGFGIRYGKSQLNVERTKCMHEIVCGCSFLDFTRAKEIPAKHVVKRWTKDARDMLPVGLLANGATREAWPLMKRLGPP